MRNLSGIKCNAFAINALHISHHACTQRFIIGIMVRTFKNILNGLFMNVFVKISIFELFHDIDPLLHPQNTQVSSENLRFSELTKCHPGITK